MPAKQTDAGEKRNVATAYPEVLIASGYWKLA
jgi:hypothetical protein